MAELQFLLLLLYIFFTGIAFCISVSQMLEGQWDTKGWLTLIWLIGWPILGPLYAIYKYSTYKPRQKQ